MKVPVKVIIDPSTKDFEVEVGTPPVSALILKELKIEKGSANQNESVGNLSIDQVKKIAEMKSTLQGGTLRARMKEILGTCMSMGIKVEEKHPIDVQKEIDEGKYKLEES